MITSVRGARGAVIGTRGTKSTATATYSSGRIGGTDQHWQTIDQALRKGYRGLPGGGSLARLLFEVNAAGLALDTLSIGMSADLEAAIAEGATIVRVGSAIFGERSRPAARRSDSDEPPH